MNKVFFKKVYKNEPFKARQGIVYVDPDLAIEILDRLEQLELLRSKYEQALTNKEEFVIIVVNALSGTLALAAREKFPKARIICVEYFPFEINHLRKMGFEVVYLEMEVKNFSVNHMNSKLQEKIHKERIACVLGNPPYHDPNNDGVKIFRDFISLSNREFVESAPIAFITPNTWLSQGDVVLAEVVKHRTIFFIDTRSQYIKDTFFPGVGSTFCWFVLTSKSSALTQIVTYEGESQFDLNLIGFIPVENTAAKVRIQPNPTTLSILNKFLNFQGDYIPGSFITTGGVGTRTEHHSVQTREFSIPCYCSTVEDKNLDYIEKATTHHNDKKVLFVSSYLHNPAVRRARYCADPVSTMNNIAYWVVTDDTDGAVIESFCNSSFMKFIIFSLTSKRDVPIPIINNIRVPCALRERPIQEVYGLSIEELSYMEKVVK